jgi:adenine deaminase
MALAANALRDCGGGFAVVHGGRVTGLLPLPIGGLLSDQPWETVARNLDTLHAAAHATGCTLSNPFLALAFLPLPVIPAARITLDGFVTC